MRRALFPRIAALDTVIDQAAGEIATLPFHPRELQGAADGLFSALTAWRAVANHLEFAPDLTSEAARVRDCLPPVLMRTEAIGNPASWQYEPRAMRTAMLVAVRRLMTLPADTPSLQLLCDRTAEGLLALCRAVSGIMVLDHPWVTQLPQHVAWLRVPDVLPALINGVRAFLTIGAAALIWVWAGWPGGVPFIEFAAIAITLFAPREDAAYATARSFTIGTALTAVCAAVVAFAVLPRSRTSLASVPCSVWCWYRLGPCRHGPGNSRCSSRWRPTSFRCSARRTHGLRSGAILNLAMALLGGVAFAMLAMRLLPPMPPEMRVRRLLALTLRDLRRLTHGRLQRSSVAWTGRMYGRLSAVPEAVDTLQPAQMTAALAVGSEIIRLRHVARRFGIAAVLEPAMTAIAAGDSSRAIDALDRFDRTLAELPATQPGEAAVARAGQCLLHHRRAEPARQLFRREGGDMRYTEINLFGVYVAPIAPMIVAGWVLLIPLRRVADRFGLLRYVWHPALFLLQCTSSCCRRSCFWRKDRAVMADADIQIRTQAAAELHRRPRLPATSAPARPAARRAGTGDADRAGAGRIATWAAVAGYMAAPWTRDGTVRAYVVTVAPEVSGRIVQLPVVDNQSVHKGDVLMVIDPTDYAIAVDQAQAAVNQATCECGQRRA